MEGLLNGASISGSIGNRTLNYNLAPSGSALGAGFGTPGIGVTYGFGPYRFGSGAIPAEGNEPASFGDRFGNFAPISDSAGSPLLRALKRYRADPMRLAEQEAVFSPLENGKGAVPKSCYPERAFSSGRPTTFDDRFARWVDTGGTIAPLAPHRAVPTAEDNRPRGIFSGEPMPVYPVPPPIFGFPEAGKPDDENWLALLLGPRRAK